MRKTKIVCTLGPSTDDPKVLKQLMLAGMDVARFNFSHGTHREHLDRLKAVKRTRTELGLFVATMMDTKGPEIRIGRFKESPVYFKQGDKFVLTTKDVEGTQEMVSVLSARLSTHVRWSPQTPSTTPEAMSNRRFQFGSAK